MKTFHLHRAKDESGVSGTGRVAEGVQLSGGKCVLHWLTGEDTIGIYESIEVVEKIHGHGGSTRVVWDIPRSKIDDLRVRIERHERDYGDPRGGGEPGPGMSPALRREIEETGRGRGGMTPLVRVRAGHERGAVLMRRMFAGSRNAIERFFDWLYVLSIRVLPLAFLATVVAALALILYMAAAIT